MISTMLTLSRKSFVISLVLPLAIFAATEAVYAAAMLLHAGTTFLLLPVVLPLVMFIYISLNSMNVTMQNYALAVHMSRTRSESITAVFTSQLITSVLSLTLSLALTLFDQLITLKVWLVISPSLDVSGFLGNVMPWLFAAAAIGVTLLISVIGLFIYKRICARHAAHETAEQEKAPNEQNSTGEGDRNG